MFYRVYDKQCNRYMHTGYNCKSKKEVHEELLSYISPDMEEGQDYPLQTILDVWEFELEKSQHKFELID